ncbi:MAG TPA: hypothetical protein VKM55_05530 [Candidatus Lokiarchaeia archaeon]|nr:hypothetical protein [Candidatus Lokiarchaeia archaeon]
MKRLVSVARASMWKEYSLSEDHQSKRREMLALPIMHQLQARSRLPRRTKLQRPKVR